MPGVAAVVSSRIPSCSWPSPSSRAEQSIPRDVSPRIVRSSIVSPPGSVAPTRAKGYLRPAVTFGAPHTTLCRSAAPSLTVQMLEAIGVGMRAHRFH